MSDLLTALPNLTDGDDSVFQPDMVEPSDTMSEYMCEVCGKPLTYSGRGRHPRFCDDHKPNQRKPAAGTRSTAGVEALKTQFLSQWQMLAYAVGSTVDEVDGEILWNGGPALTDALGNVMAVNPKFKRAMTQWMQATVYTQVAMAVAPMFALIAMHHGWISPSKKMMAMMADAAGGDTDARPPDQL